MSPISNCQTSKQIKSSIPIITHFLPLSTKNTTVKSLFLLIKLSNVKKILLYPRNYAKTNEI